MRRNLVVAIAALGLVSTTIATGFAAFVLPAPAIAQTNDNDYTPLNSRIRRKREFPLQPPDAFKPAALTKLNRLRNGQMLDQFSKCVYRRDRTQALDLLGKTDYGFVNFEQVGLENEKAARIFGFKDCLTRVADSYGSSVGLRWNAATLRSWIVREAYFDRFPDGPDWAKPGNVVDERTFPLSQDNPQVQALMDFADCVVAGNPNAADYFFRTPSGAEEESDAIQKLAPSISPCLPNGEQAKINPAALRIWLGEALWFAATNSHPPLPESQPAPATAPEGGH